MNIDFKHSLLKRVLGKIYRVRQPVDLEAAAIAASGLFHDDWYLDNNRDVKAAGIDALSHYNRYGRYEGRNPNQLFDTRWYLETYPDVANSNINPLIHYIKYGESEGRRPSPNFDPHAYRCEVGDNVKSDGGLLRSFLERLQALNREDSLNFIAANHNGRARTSIGIVAPHVGGPLISIILPVYNSDIRYLREAIVSVLGQKYERWELLAIDDGSTNQDVIDVLKLYSKQDKRVRVHLCDENGGIARASQIGLELSGGEFVAFLDHDDVLSETALHDVVTALNSDQAVDYVYTDHGMIDKESRFLHAAVKPSWSPEFLLSTNYIVHFKVIRRENLMKIGGFRPGSEVIQDLDVSLRLCASGAKLLHLPLMLYFWRVHPSSVASGTGAKPSIERLAIRVYNEYLASKGCNAEVEWPVRFKSWKVGAYKVRFSPETINRDVAILMWVFDAATFDIDAIKKLKQPNAEFYIIWCDAINPAPRLKGCKAVVIANNDELYDFIIGLEQNRLVFVSGTARLLHDGWAKELVGYLDMDSDIGLVGGKILDSNLCVASGAISMVNTPSVVFKGSSDNDDGYWLNLQVASNVAAVSAGLMAVRRTDIERCGKLELFKYREWSGVLLSRQLVAMGKRVVFNPWSKVWDCGEFLEAPQQLKLQIADDVGPQYCEDEYYNPSLSRVRLFAL